MPIPIEPSPESKAAMERLSQSLIGKPVNKDGETIGAIESSISDSDGISISIKLTCCPYCGQAIRKDVCEPAYSPREFWIEREEYTSKMDCFPRVFGKPLSRFPPEYVNKRFIHVREVIE